MMSLEDQQEQQLLEQQNQFNDWFYGPEIQGLYVKATEALKDKLPFVIDIFTLQLAFFYRESKKQDIQTDTDDLPF